ncbi:MAG: hypothetical protein QME93_00495 [Bacillota bacterium]|nr:hypothetical protein [Bacillota bacterium]MDI7248532.1 hypothetical protein [Bacillota bacterium]
MPGPTRRWGALDGLGGVGDGGHSPDEYVVLDGLSQRTPLLVRLLEII